MSLWGVTWSKTSSTARVAPFPSSNLCMALHSFRREAGGGRALALVQPASQAQHPRMRTLRLGCKGLHREAPLLAHRLAVLSPEASLEHVFSEHQSLLGSSISGTAHNWGLPSSGATLQPLC